MTLTSIRRGAIKVTNPGVSHRTHLECEVCNDPRGVRELTIHRAKLHAIPPVMLKLCHACLYEIARQAGNLTRREPVDST